MSVYECKQTHSTCLLTNVLSTNQEVMQVSKLVLLRSAYERQVTIKTLVQSETIGKTKIPSFLCKSSLCTTLASEQVTSDHVYVRVHEFPAPPIHPALGTCQQ